MDNASRVSGSSGALNLAGGAFVSPLRYLRESYNRATCIVAPVGCEQPRKSCDEVDAVRAVDLVGLKRDRSSVSEEKTKHTLVGDKEVPPLGTERQRDIDRKDRKRERGRERDRQR